MIHWGEAKGEKLKAKSKKLKAKGKKQNVKGERFYVILGLGC